MNRKEEFNRHFSNEISKDLKTFVIDDVLLYSRYLYVKRMTSTIQRGYCTHCKSNHTITADNTLKHNESWQCEKCKSLVFVKSAGRGRGKMLDRAYVIWYEKSLLDSKAITATGYNVFLDYRSKMDGELIFHPVAKYLFQEGKATMMKRDYEEWIFTKNPYTMIGKSFITQDSKQSIESIHSAVKGTSFEYSEWQIYLKQNMDMVIYFSLFAKYPFLEYFLKMGMKKIVDTLVNKGSTYRVINFKGKNMMKILGLYKSELKEWKKSGVEMDVSTLYNYKWFRRNGINASWKTAELWKELLQGSYYMNRLNQLREHLPLKDIVNYIDKQINKETSIYSSAIGQLISWTDYLGECKDLGIDINQKRNIMPNNLYKAHQKTMRAIKIKEDKLVNQKITKRQPKLKNYHFESGEFFIRPALSSIEIFDEGKALKHCVARYSNDYADGKTIILVIRKTEEPETPFYTVEIDPKNNRIVQCQGIKHKEPTKDVEAFLVEYKNKLKKKAERKMAV